MKSANRFMRSLLVAFLRMKCRPLLIGFGVLCFVSISIAETSIEKPLPNKSLKLEGFEYVKNNRLSLEKRKIEDRAKSLSLSQVTQVKVRERADFKEVIQYASFSSQSIDINSLVKRILALHKKRQILQIHVVGHTDNQRIRARPESKIQNNQDLSESRARQVAEVLQKENLKIPISFEGMADRKPLASNRTEAGRAKNRRAVLNIFVKNSEAPNKAHPVPVKKTEKLLLAQLECAPLTELSSTPVSPMRISLDGRSFKRVSPQKGEFQKNSNAKKETGSHVDFQRCTDVALAKSKIQVHYDPLVSSKRLSFSPRFFTNRGQLILESNLHANYERFIEKAELRVFRHKQSPESEPLLIWDYKKSSKLHGFEELIGEVQLNHLVHVGEKLDLYLRVYDADGAFDETEAHVHRVKSQYTSIPSIQSWARNDEKAQLRVSQIDVNGGRILVNGKDLPTDYEVFVMGQKVALGKSGKFVNEQILRSGENYAVQIVIRDSRGQVQRSFKRDLHVPDNDWFLIALADATVGYNLNDTKKAAIITQDTHHYDEKIFVDGRTAFYLKGKMRGKYILTAHADTREGPVDQLFSNFLDKNPRDLFRRLDPEEFYPVYGDDSTLKEDAPTSGKFYVKLERNKSHVMWGNFKVALNDTELARQNRGYHGGHLKIREGKTKWGESAQQVDLYAADPGTVLGRQDFRGGSSQYWLRNRDIAVGSEQVYVEIRDRDSGRVLKRTVLRYGEDYEVNYLQGHISLDERIPSTSDNSRLVQAGALSGHPVYLIVSYEYTPGFSDPDQWEMGGRASFWLGDHVQVGATAHRQEDPSSGSQHELYAGDAQLKISSDTKLKVEYAKTKGSSQARLESIDGGYSFNQPSNAIPAPNSEAQAYLAEIEAKIYQQNHRSGKVAAFYKSKEAGFSAAGEESTRDTDLWGAEANLPIGSSMKLKALYDERREKNWVDSRKASADLELAWTDRFYTNFGGLYSSEKDQSSGTSASTVLNPQFGERIDTAARVGLRQKSEWDVYGLGQMTVSKDGNRSDNNRYGLGFEAKLSSEVKLSAEGTHGDGGLAVKATASYEYDEDSELYTSYLSENERSDSGLRSSSGKRLGQFVSGVKSKYSDDSKVYYENQYIHGDRPSGLAHTFGVEHEADKNWSFNLGIEIGDLESEDGSSKTSRQAYSLGVDYKSKNTAAGSQFELRIDDNKSVGSSSKRQTYINKSKFEHKFSESWRALAKLKWQRSFDSQGDFYDGDYTDGILGFAYRPIDHNKWNFLFKYRVFDLEPSPGQVGSDGQIPEFQQQDHIVSADVNWAMTKPLTLGAKYALNFSSLRNNRLNNSPWFSLRKHLGVLRADLHLVKRWDFLLEGRALHLEGDGADQWKYGALTALYRQLAEKHSLKLGLGYNFGTFSDDLTDNSYEAHGIFLNLIGAY